MTEVIEEKEVKKVLPKTPLTEDELLEVWKQDEFWGIGGSYISDLFTGKRTPRED